MPVFERANILHRAATFWKRAKELAGDHGSWSARIGNPPFPEVTRTADLLRYTADMGRAWGTGHERGELPSGSRTKSPLSPGCHWERRGAGASPPLTTVNLSASKIGPALRRQVLHRPATRGNRALIWQKIIPGGGAAPTASLNTVTGRGSQLETLSSPRGHRLY